MSDEHFDQLEQLFQAARGRPPEERRTFLDVACSDNLTLRRELETLLRADAEADEENFLGAPAWPHFLHEVRQFLGVDAGNQPPRLDPLELPALDRLPRVVEPETSDRDLSGRRVAHYDDLTPLGRGGMGVVYKARDRRLGRTVALKFLPPSVSTDETVKHRFIQEARAASALDHPNICTIYEVGEADDALLYLAMACYKGETLDHKIERGPLPISQTLDYAIQVAAGLEAAHEAGIVHRDVKPANVMVTERGLVKLLDFGIAKVANMTLTQTGTALGTVAYMSPEQVRGEPVDRRTDLWALGVVLYEMLTGQRPFGGLQRDTVMYAIAHHTPKRATALRPELPTRLDAFFARALHKEVDGRFPSAQAMRRALQQERRRLKRAPTTSAPAPAGVSGSAPGVAVPPPAPRAPLIVGRDEELETLLRCFARACDGERQIVFVTGEPGLGKTTLIDVFLHRIQTRNEVRIGRGQCLEHRGEGEPYLPVLEALERLCVEHDGSEVIATLKTDAPTWLVQMPWLLRESELVRLQHRIIGTTPERMLREFVHAMERLTTDRPLVLVLEDLHWSDPSTVQLIDGLARRREPARLLVLGTYRPAEVRTTAHPLHEIQHELRLRDRCTQIPLPLLSESATADFLRHQLGGSTLPDGLARLVHRRTSGNPLFVRTLVEFWKAQGLIVEATGDRWHLDAPLERLDGGVPETLRQLIEQRLRRMTPGDQQMLEAAGVVGAEFSTAAVAAGYDAVPEDVELRCTQLARAELFLGGGDPMSWPDGTVATRFHFAHSLYQEVLYDRVPAGRRVQLHRRIGRRLEAAYGDRAREHAAELALHFTRGNEPARAVKYLQEAAEHALQRSAHREAIRHLATGVGMLRMLPRTEEHIRREIAMQTQLASAHIATEGWAAPEAEKAYHVAHELCQQLDTSSELVPVLFGMASMYELRGEYKKSQMLIEKRLELSAVAEEGGPMLESHELFACSTFHQGAFDHALEHAEHGLTLYDADQHYSLLAIYGDDPGVACHDWAALSLWFLGFPDQALARARQAVDLAQDHFYSLASAQTRAAWLHQCRREVALTRQWAEQAIELAHEQGFPYHLAVGTILHGWTRAMEGHIEAGLAQIQQGIDDCRAAGAEMDHPYFLALLVEAYSRHGQPAEGLEALDEAIARVRNSRAYFYEADLYRLKGVLYLQSDERDGLDDAEACFQQALDVARQQGALSLELRAAVSQSRLWHQMNQTSEAHALLSEVYHRFTEGFDTPDLIEAKALLDVLS